MKDIPAIVREFIITRDMIVRGDRLLLSLSAGKDSMALLHILLTIRDEIGYDLGIFHLNHCMRGAESDGDEEFIRKTASDLSLPIYIERHDFPADTDAAMSFEDHARHVRYRLLEAISAEHGYKRIVTAHTLDDQVETVLMRILTGTGIYGLRGIDETRDGVIRPLLCLSSQDVYDYLADKGIGWREDSTNTDLSHPRNRIRHEILPVIRKTFPVDSSIPALAGHAREVAALLDRLSEPLRIDPEESDKLIVRYADVRDDYPLFKHLLARFCRDSGRKPLTERVYREIESNLSSQKKHVTLYRSGNLTIERMIHQGVECIMAGTPRAEGHEHDVHWQYTMDIMDGLHIMEIPGTGLSLEAGIVTADEFSVHVGEPGWVFTGLKKETVTCDIRNRRPGDRIILETGTVKIKDFFIQKKLDTWRRMRVPLLIIDGQVAAIMTGLTGSGVNRIAAGFMVSKESEKIFALHSRDELY